MTFEGTLTGGRATGTAKARAGSAGLRGPGCAVAVPVGPLLALRARQGKHHSAKWEAEPA